MNLTPLRLGTLIVLTLITVAAGCATTQDTEHLLSAAGFNSVAATSPQQQSDLKSLPPDKVSRVPRHGTNFYVYPDARQQMLYVGQEPQYQEYQRLRLQKQEADENLEAEELGSTTDWAAWGPWSAPVVVPMIRR